MNRRFFFKAVAAFPILGQFLPASAVVKVPKQYLMWSGYPREGFIYLQWFSEKMAPLNESLGWSYWDTSDPQLAWIRNEDGSEIVPVRDAIQ